MPRDAAGSYTLVAGNPVLSGTVISSSWANTTLNDVSTALTDSLDRYGRGGMLASFRFADGTKLLPSASFVNETSSGLYREDSGDVRMAILTQDVMRWQTSGVEIWDNVLLQWFTVTTTNNSGDLLPLNNTWTGLNTFTGGLESGGAGVQSFRAGPSAASTNQGIQATAVGTNSGDTNQGAYSVAVGTACAETSQGTKSTAIGWFAGSISQGVTAVAVGSQAGYTGQGDTAVAVGSEAGKTTQGIGGVAIGLFSGQASQGANSVAIGNAAGQTTQATETVAIGHESGTTTQGTQAVAVGTNSGETSQSAYSVAVGPYCGNLSQGTKSTAIGWFAGSISQGAASVAIGGQAGYTGQLASAVAVGNEAGKTTQGANAIAVGSFAGQTSQHANSIVISSKGSAVNTASIGDVKIESSTAWLRASGANWTSSGTTGNVSDIRLKENVEPITGALAKVNTLNGITFSYIENGAVATGLIAQEVQAVLPEAVIEDEDGYLAVGYGNMVGLLVESIKELTAKVEALEA